MGFSLLGLINGGLYEVFLDATLFCLEQASKKSSHDSVYARLSVQPGSINDILFHIFCLVDDAPCGNFGKGTASWVVDWARSMPMVQQSLDLFRARGLVSIESPVEIPLAEIFNGSNMIICLAEPEWSIDALSPPLSESFLGPLSDAMCRQFRVTWVIQEATIAERVGAYQVVYVSLYSITGGTLPQESLMSRT